jgi:hypothetical protein
MKGWKGGTAARFLYIGSRGEEIALGFDHFIFGEKALGTH